MTATINATTTNGVVVSGDTSGALALQTNNGTTAVTLDTNQNATFVGAVSCTNTFGYKNRLFNGNTNIWQRGTSFTNSANSLQYTADRWAVFSGAGYAAATSQVASGVQSSPLALRIQRPNGATYTGAEMLAVQVIESINCYDLSGNYVTVSLTAKAGGNFSGSGGAFNIKLVTGTGIDQGSLNCINAAWTTQAVSTQTVTITTTATRYSVTFLVPTGTNEVAVQFGWTPTGTAGAADYVDITEVQLEKSRILTSYDYRDWGTELTRCLRYFEKSFGYGTAPAHNVGGLPVIPIGSSLGCGGNAYWTIPFKVEKRNTSYAIRWYDPLAAHTSTENWVRAIGSCDSGNAYGPNTYMQFNSLTTTNMSGYSQVGTATPPIMYWTVDNEL